MIKFKSRFTLRCTSSERIDEIKVRNLLKEIRNLGIYDLSLNKRINKEDSLSSSYFSIIIFKFEENKIKYHDLFPTEVLGILYNIKSNESILADLEQVGFMRRHLYMNFNPNSRFIVKEFNSNVIELLFKLKIELDLE